MEQQLHPLVRALEEKRRARGWTHARMAQELAVDRKIWMYTKAGRMDVGNSLRVGAARLFDDLRDLALAKDGAVRKEEDEEPEAVAALP